MSFKLKVNQVRRDIMHGLTQNLGSSSKVRAIGGKKIEIKRILISRPNSRLGNQILITPLIQEVSDTFPECKIDLFVRGYVAEIIFENYKNVDRIIKLPKKPFKDLGKYIKVWFSLRKYNYDIVINVDKVSSSGRLSTLISNGKIKFFCDSYNDLEVRYNDYLHIAKFPVYNLRSYLTQLGYKETNKPVPPLDLKLSSAERTKGKEVLDSLVSNTKKTIAIYTFATGTKCYSVEWWMEVYGRLKSEFGKEYNILEVLPVENVSQIGFDAPSYYSKDLREIAAVIASTELFLGADSGMMHLASSALTPVVGLFSVTSVDKYQPYGANSVAIHTDTAGVEDIIHAISKILMPL